PACLSLDQGVHESFSSRSVMMDEIAHIAADIGIGAASDSLLDPLPHVIGERYVHRCHGEPPLSKYSNLIQICESNCVRPKCGHSRLAHCQSGLAHELTTSFTTFAGEQPALFC